MGRRNISRWQYGVGDVLAIPPPDQGWPSPRGAPARHQSLPSAAFQPFQFHHRLLDSDLGFGPQASGFRSSPARSRRRPPIGNGPWRKALGLTGFPPDRPKRRPRVPTPIRREELTTKARSTRRTGGNETPRKVSRDAVRTLFHRKNSLPSHSDTEREVYLPVAQAPEGTPGGSLVSAAVLGYTST